MTRQMMGIGLLTAAMLVGCGREDATTGAKSQRTAAEAADRAASDTKDAADARIAADREAADDAEAAAHQAAADTQAAADARIAADRQAAADAKIAADKAAEDTQAAAAERITADRKAADEAAAKIVADDNTAKATSLLAQLTQQIKDGDLDLADKTLAQIDAMIGNLPASLREKVESARTALNAKKDAGNLVK